MPQKSTPITKELEGNWARVADREGTYPAPALNSPMARTARPGVLVSLDQNSVEVPVATVTQQGSA